MGDRTMPESHNDEYRMALRGIRAQAKAHKVDLSLENNVLFINHLAEVQAQISAENRWLRRMNLPETMKSNQESYFKPLP